MFAEREKQTQASFSATHRETQRQYDISLFEARASEHTETCASDTKNVRSSQCIYRDRNKTETETRETNSRQSLAWEQGRIGGAVGDQQD